MVRLDPRIWDFQREKPAKLKYLAVHFKRDGDYAARLCRDSNKAMDQEPARDRPVKNPSSEDQVFDSV